MDDHRINYSNSRRRVPLRVGASRDHRAWQKKNFTEHGKMKTKNEFSMSQYLFGLSILLLSAFLSGCYDHEERISEMADEVSDLESRIEELEGKIDELEYSSHEH